MNSKRDAVGVGQTVSAFTLVELLAVLIIAAALFAVLLPSLAVSKPASQAFQCLENQRRMLLAWRLYSDDYNDRIVQTGSSSYTADSIGDTSVTNGNWVHGDMSMPLACDPALVQAGALFAYAKNLKLYKCPADAKILPSGIPTPRSISMNAWLNPIGNSTGAFGSGRARVFRTQSDITNPPPANMWVILDEQPGSINDGWFMCDPFGYPDTWVDVPASYHNGGCGISFADGHSQIKTWTDRFLLRGTLVFTPRDPSSTDLHWLQARSTSEQ